MNIDACKTLLAAPERFCSAERLKKCADIGSESVRIQGYAAELALSVALTGDRLSPPVYRYGENGKPGIDGGFISLTHSGRWAACAYSPVPVGIDMEELRPIGRGISRRILAPSELVEFAGTADENYLLRKFVLKEAFFKLTGEGIAGGFRDVFETCGGLYRRGVLEGHPFHFEGSGYLGCVVTASESQPDIFDAAVLLSL